MRRALQDTLMSIGAIGFVLVLLIATDGQLREEVTQSVRQSRAPMELVSVSKHVRDLTTVAVQIVKNESRQHTSLMILVGAATLLTLFMVRT